MATSGTGIPAGVQHDFLAPPLDHDDAIPLKVPEREELHAYVRTENKTWILWAIGAFVLVAFFFLWWGYYAARPIDVQRTPDQSSTPPPPLQ